MSAVELHTILGDLDVTHLNLRLFLRGNWTGTCRIGWPDLPPEGSPAELRIARSGGTIDTFAGAVRRANQIPGTQDISVTIVGGAGRLLSPTIPARHHSSGPFTVPAGLVLAGIAQAAGERLAAGVEAAIDAYQLRAWTRVAGEPWAAVDLLAAYAAPGVPLGWRMLSDGTIWVGVETWVPVDGSAFYYSGDPRDGSVWYIADGARFRPGTTIDGARVIECCYRIKPGDATMEARVAMPGDPVHVPPLEAYARSYVATVASQNADLTLNLFASDPTLGNDLRNVAFKLGIPGTKVTFPAGAVVRVSFAGGSPSGIYAGDVDMDPAATKPFALKDDAVRCGTLTGVADPGTGVVTFVWTPANGDLPSMGAAANINGFVFGPSHAYARGVRA